MTSPLPIRLPPDDWPRDTRDQFDGARAIVLKLADAGHQALLAGGCVRDIRLGRIPKDFDVATSATPDKVQALFTRTRAVGVHFGVILVQHRGISIEVATFRKDGPYQDGRRPSHVTFSTAEEDARRRDFTINGLFLDPLDNAVIDYVRADPDFDHRHIRAIGDPALRFGEDYLRMLRAIRFSASLDFEIELATWTALTRLAPRIGSISAERVRDELSRMLTCPGRRRAIELLVDSGLARGVLPELLPLQGCDQPPQYHPEGDVYIHTLLMLDLLPDDAPLELAWAVLLHDIGKPQTRTVDTDGRIRFNGHDAVGAAMTRDILTRLRYPNKVIENIESMVGRHMQFMHVQQMRTSRLKRFMAEPTFEDELELHRVDCLSCHGMLDNHEFLQRKRAEFDSEPSLPAPLLRGHDLIDLGLRPGPRFKAILDDAMNLQLEGEITGRQQALDWLKQRVESTSCKQPASHSPNPEKL